MGLFADDKQFVDLGEEKVEETKQQVVEAASSAKETVQEPATETKETVAAAAEVPPVDTTGTVQGRIIFSILISIPTLI